ncbi:MAG: phosphocholine cytidylyltransferase family protein, partial [Clostridiales bacterium]|nr:phosphocholine cytidylyltransferase family protein [Clostridiales bacterium]
MQAVMLAAGQGKRLGKYTKENTKCMVEVAGKTLLEHAVESIKKAGIRKLVMVVGYQKEKLKHFVKEHIHGIEVIFIDNQEYENTNNIYSLFLAKEYLENDDTILLESDLIFEEDLISQLVADPRKNMAVVAKYEHWMDGTVVLVDQKANILEFIDKHNFSYEKIDQYHKTVNIYKLSKEFSKNQYFPFLQAYMKAYGKNEYYEAALKAIAYLSKSGLQAFHLQNALWYEIDDGQDLRIAQTLFSKGEDKIANYQKSYGGYWRYNKMLDFCYLVNPYFPTDTMMEKMTSFYEKLVRAYPSGMEVQASL